MKCPNGHDSVAVDYCDTCGEAMAGGQQPAAEVPASEPDQQGVGSLDVEAATPTPGDRGGSGIDSDGVGAAPGGDEGVPCPNCGVPNAGDALFCENCGYDHTTGTMPRREPTETDGGPADPAGTSGGGPLPNAALGPGDNPAPVLDPPWVAEVWIDPQWYAQQESPDPLPSPGLPAVVPLRHTSLLIGRVSHSRGITPDIDCGTDNGVSRRHAQLTTDGQRWWVEDLASSNGTFIGDATAPPPSRSIPVGAKREVGADDRIYVGSWTRIVLRPAAEGEA